MATPSSATPRPERRNRIIRQSISHPPSSFIPPSDEDIAPPKVDDNFGEGECHQSASSLPALYHQICIQSPNQNVQPPPPFGTWAPQSVDHFEGQRIPLLHKVQILHGIEVLCKRLLFHLVKTSAFAPKFFLFLPFALFALSLLFCTSAWPPRPLRFLFPADSLKFGVDPNGGCFLANRPNLAHFPEDNPAFDAPQWNSASQFAVLISTPSGAPMDFSNPNGPTLTAAADLFRQIQDLTVQHQKQIYKWWDLCRQCQIDPVLEHLVKADLDWHFPESNLLAENGTIGGGKLFLAGTIGDPEMDPSNPSSLRRAHSLLMRIKLRPQLKPALVDAFERRLRRIVSNFSRLHSPQNEDAAQQPILRTNFWSSQRLSDEIEFALRGIHGRMGLSWLAISALLALVQCRPSAYESRPFLGIQQSFVLLLSVIFAYSVHLASADHLNPLLFPLPYALAPIAILTFASVDSSFQRYSGISMHPTEKMAFLAIWDGPSVVLGLLWLILFCLISSFLVHSVFLLQFLLAFSAGLVSLLLFTLSFLLVCWLGTARRIASGLKWFQICRSGDQAFNEKQMFDYDAHTCARLHEKLADLRPNFARRFGQFACGPNFRTLAFALFCVCCIGCLILGLANARIRLEPVQFVPPNGQSRAFVDRFRGAFQKYEDYLELNFDGPIDYSERKEQIFALLNWPLEAELASRSVSWLSEFDKFQKTVAYRVDEESSLPLLTHIFLQSNQFRKFAADLRISQGQIHQSRMYLELTAKGREQSEFLIRSLLERARQMGLPLFLDAPFTFSLEHDIQVLPRLLSAFLWLSALSALLSGFQPALALCLFASNLFISGSVHSICSSLLSVPLNILTLGTLLAFGVPLNSFCLLHFAHHFFNSGPRQQQNPLRIQYAFQCAIWPIFLACFSGPFSFSLQFLFSQSESPPILLAIWKVLAVSSSLIFLQICVFLPTLLALCSDFFHDIFTFALQICDENANAELTVDPMAENVYFVPTFQRQTAMGANANIWTMAGNALGFGPHAIYPLDSGPFRPPLCVPPAYQPPPIDFPRKSAAHHAISAQHSRQQSQCSQQQNSPRERRNHPNPGMPIPIYSPPNRRKEMAGGMGGGSKTDSGNNSFSESLESRAEMRIQRRKSQTPLATVNSSSSNSFLAPPNRSSNFRHQMKPPNRCGGDEQIYEEPDTPNMDRKVRMEEGTKTNAQQQSPRAAFYNDRKSPGCRRKYQIV